jgi:hypothetical protein
MFGYHVAPSRPSFSIATHWYSIGIVVSDKVLRFVTSPSIVVNKTVLPGAVMLSSCGNNGMG